MTEYKYQFSNEIGLPWVIEKMPQYLFPDLSKKKDRIRKKLAGVIATLEKNPVGLILSSFDPSGKTVRIHSLLVHPDHRKKGIAQHLFRELEQATSNLGATKISGYFRSHWKSGPALVSILKKRGWSEPKEDLIIVKGEAEKVLKLFMVRELALPPDYSFVTYDALTSADRVYISDRGREGWYLDYLNPFVHEKTILAPASIFMRHQGKVIGWVISHLIAPDLNEFTALFVDPDHRPYKQAHLLMRKAIFEQRDHGVPNFLITSKSDNYVMSRFLLRHAAETEVFLTKSMYSEKDLAEII